MRADGARPPRTPARRHSKSFGSLNLSSFLAFIFNLLVKYNGASKVAQCVAAAPPVLEQCLRTQFQMGKWQRAIRTVRLRLDRRQP
jgi:hypothetical protein